MPGQFVYYRVSRRVYITAEGLDARKNVAAIAVGRKAGKSPPHLMRAIEVCDQIRMRVGFIKSLTVA